MALPTKHAVLPLGEAVSAWRPGPAAFFTSFPPLVSSCLTYMDNTALRAVRALLGSFWEGWKQGRLFKHQLIPHRGADNHISSTVIAAIMGK